MPITWNEARKLNADLLAKRGREAIMARFPVGSKARITEEFYIDPRVWGDTVTITADCSFDVGEGFTPAVCANHEVYGDVGWIFTADELEPLP